MKKNGKLERNPLLKTLKGATTFSTTTHGLTTLGEVTIRIVGLIGPHDTQHKTQHIETKRNDTHNTDTQYYNSA